MQRRIDPDRLQRSQIEGLHVRWIGLQDHLILMVLVQPVGILAEAAIGGPARRLDIGDPPGLGPERAKHRGRVQGPRADLGVVGLQNDAALAAPVVVQFQDQALK